MQKKTPKILNAHAKRRAAERYDLALNKDARREIVQMIQTNRAEFVSRQSNNRSLWRVAFQDKSLNVVYDRQRSTLCTVLPPEAREFKQTDWREAEREERKANTRNEITAELAELWKDEEPATGA
jgi:hypothetical protein